MQWKDKWIEELSIQTIVIVGIGREIETERQKAGLEWDV